MINYHPERSVLVDFATGELSASVSVIVASHVEMCDVCRQQVERISAEAAQAAFMQDTDFVHFSAYQEKESQAELTSSESATDNSFVFDDDALAMIDNITLQADIIDENSSPAESEFIIAGHTIKRPRALSSIELKECQTLGKLSRSRLLLEDDNLRTSLLAIDKGGSIPSHTHQGFEMTLLLQGSFEDEMGHYQAGDFICLDRHHTHQPITHEGCVCLTVSSDRIHFTKGMSKLINPIGKLIY